MAFVFRCSLVFTELRESTGIRNITCVFDENLQEVYLSLFFLCVWDWSCLGLYACNSEGILAHAYPQRLSFSNSDWYTHTLTPNLSLLPLFSFSAFFSQHFHFRIRLNCCIIRDISCIWWCFYQQHKRNETLHANAVSAILHHTDIVVRSYYWNILENNLIY